MIAAEMMVPCLAGDGCRLDWAAVSAVGGWVAAIVTFFAVLLPYRAQRKMADEERRLAATDAEARLGKFVHKLFFLHNSIPKIRSAVARPGYVFQKDVLDRWMTKASSLPFPDMPRRIEFENVRKSLAVLEVCIEVLAESREIEDWSTDAKMHFAETVSQVDQALKNFVQTVDRLMPTMSIHEEFSRYFPERQQ